MAVASVTMFCACFSNGMSIMLPWKVNAPWKRENINFLSGPLETVVGLSFPLQTHPFGKKHRLPQESCTRRQTNRDGANAFKEMQRVPSKGRQKEREKRSPVCSLPVSASLAGRHRGPRAGRPCVPAGGDASRIQHHPLAPGLCHRSGAKLRMEGKGRSIVFVKGRGWRGVFLTQVRVLRWCCCTSPSGLRCSR